MLLSACARSTRELAYAGIWYAMSGTGLVCPASRLRMWYAMSGSELAYADCGVCAASAEVPTPYQLPTPYLLCHADTNLGYGVAHMLCDARY